MTDFPVLVTIASGAMCPGAARPRNARSISGNGAKGFGKALGVCDCGDTRFVKGGKIYRHKKD